ncbi:reverse transcriptase domain-containing protein [Tanacetum coccineum]
MRSPRVHRQRERVVGFKDAPNREGSRTERNTEGNRPLEAGVEENRRQEMNLPPFLVAYLGRNENGQPLQSSLTFVHRGLNPQLTYEGISLLTPTKEVHEDVLSSHNIKQREGESVRAFATRYTYDTLQILGLHEDHRISGFVHGLRTSNLVEHLSTDLPSTYKVMENGECYHQIQMAEEDEEKTAFFEGKRVYYYRKMPFGLKSAGTTYQRLLDKVFNEKIGRNLKAYVDDMVIKMPIHGEVLMMYLTASTESISAAIFTRREEGQENMTSCSEQGATTTKKRQKKLIEPPPDDNRKEVGRKTEMKLEEMKPSCEWKLYTGRASIFDCLGAGLMLINPKGKEYTYALRFEFETTNDKAEYEALLAGLRIAQEMEIVNLAIFVDSQLLINQIKGIYAAKQPAIREYLQRTKETLRSTSRMSIKEKEVLQVKTKDEESWMTPIHEYLLSGLLPDDSKESKKIKIKALQYKLIRGSLYKKSFHTPWLCCITPPKTDDVIKEIYEGCEKCKEQFAVRKRTEIRAIATGIAWPFSH